MRGERGTAMLLALVLLAAGSGLLLTFAMLARGAVGEARVVVERTQSVALVEGAIEAMIPGLFAEGAAERFRERTEPVAVTVGDTDVQVTVRESCGRWDLNRGRLEVLEQVLSGAPSAQAFVGLVREIREGSEPFATIEQALALPGLSEEMRDRLRPLLTVQCGAGFVDLVHADPLLAKAIRKVEAGGTLVSGTGPGRVWYVSAEHGAGPGSLVAVEAVIALSGDPARPFRVLEWRSSE